MTETVKHFYCTLNVRSFVLFCFQFSALVEIYVWKRSLTKNKDLIEVIIFDPRLTSTSLLLWFTFLQLEPSTHLTVLNTHLPLTCSPCANFTFVNFYGTRNIIPLKIVPRKIAPILTITLNLTQGQFVGGEAILQGAIFRSRISTNMISRETWKQNIFQ